jgi:hypothetical protein
MKDTLRAIRHDKMLILIWVIVIAVVVGSILYFNNATDHTVMQWKLNQVNEVYSSSGVYQ